MREWKLSRFLNVGQKRLLPSCSFPQVYHRSPPESAAVACQFLYSENISILELRRPAAVACQFLYSEVPHKRVD